MTLEFRPNNIFQINNPREWWCRVSSLTSAHSTMCVDVIPLQQDSALTFGEVVHIKFRKVAYFSGWLTWTGANFRRGDYAEKARLIRSTFVTYSHLPDEELVHSPEFGTLTLFIATGEMGKQTQILANAASLFDKEDNTLLQVG